MNLELTGDVAPVRDDRVRRQEKPVGYLPPPQALLLFVRPVGVFVFNNDKALYLLFNPVLFII